MKEHCRRGHPYAGDNLLITNTGERRCKACRRASGRRSDARKAERARAATAARRVEAEAAGFVPHRAHICHEVEFLAGTDDPDQLANRLDYANADNLIAVLNRWRRKDLAARLARAS